MAGSMTIHDEMLNQLLIAYQTSEFIEAGPVSGEEFDKAFTQDH